jgi:hypothetical protein
VVDEGMGIAMNPSRFGVKGDKTIANNIVKVVHARLVSVKTRQIYVVVSKNNCIFSKVIKEG